MVLALGFLLLLKKKKDPKRAPVLPFLPPFQMLLLREDRSFIYVMISNFQKFSVCFLRLLFPQRTFLLFSVSLRASEVCAHPCVSVLERTCVRACMHVHLCMHESACLCVCVLGSSDPSLPLCCTPGCVDRSSMLLWGDLPALVVCGGPQVLPSVSGYMFRKAPPPFSPSSSLVHPPPLPVPWEHEGEEGWGSGLGLAATHLLLPRRHCPPCLLS